MNKYLLSALLVVAQLSSYSVLAHEDHGARHGGFVMMFLDMHFELVAPQAGGVELYYSDALRIELPAAVVSDVAVEIERAGNRIETVFMTISDTGDHWTGESTPVIDPETIVRIAFLFQGEPFVLDIPAAVLPRLNLDMDMATECEQDCVG